MSIYILVVALACVLPVHTQSNWLFHSDILDPADNMKAFFEQQKTRIENVINSGYENAKKMKNSLNTYVEEQQKKISNVADSWSYLPSDDVNAKLDNPEVVLTVPSIVVSHGYTCETHTVVSQGYVLNIHRIPRSKNGGAIPKRTVFLQHGLFASSADWILNGPEKGLAYVLADAGYDVWMSNIRGNRYSREHISLKTSSKSYWNFSWHDIALYDIPEVIDYILKIKDSGTKITYIGHSMGTTILFAMLSLRPEYNSILSAGFALAPVVFLTDLKSPLKSLAPMASNIAYMEMLYGSHEFIPKQSSLGRISSSCKVDNMDSAVCKSIIFYICGYDEQQFNKTILPVFLAHLGTGTSWKTAVHFSQEVVSGGKFQKFDYGSYHNQKMYGTQTPPEYDLSRITLPITLFWAENDLLSSEKDVKMLYEKLPSTTELYKIPFDKFNHLDYLWAVDAGSLLNEKILQSLDKVHKFEADDFYFGIKFGK